MLPAPLRGQKQVKLTRCLPICCHDRLCWVHPDLLINYHYFQRKKDSIFHFVCSCTLHAGHIGADGGTLQGILFVKDFFVFVLSSFDKIKWSVLTKCSDILCFLQYLKVFFSFFAFKYVSPKLTQTTSSFEQIHLTTTIGMLLLHRSIWCKKTKQKKHTGENTKAVAKGGQNQNFLANLFDFWGIGSSLGLRASDIILNALHAILEKHAWLWDK